MVICNSFNSFVVLVFLLFLSILCSMSLCKLGLFFVVLVVQHTVIRCTCVVVIVEDNSHIIRFSSPLSLFCVELFQMTLLLIHVCCLLFVSLDSCSL